MNFEPSARARDFRDRVRRFVDEQVIPAERTYAEQLGGQDADWTRWRVPPVMEELKRRAREHGLWNLFLPDAELGAGLSVTEYAPIAEEMGRSLLAPEAFNCSAPDTGNMEVLHRYGSDAQKERWLRPLLAGEIRSVFCMTEPEVASSDATNMRASATLDADAVVLNGRKWWSSGLGHPNARVAIFMGLTASPGADRHHQHSMVLVPLDAPGVRIERMLPVYGDFDAPHGHGEVSFTDVRLPADAIIAGPGMGFEIAQGRLGPGRIHHCMRCIGAAERALELMVRRGAARSAFGRRLIDLGGNRERIADARVAIDQARLLTLQAAWKLETLGAMASLAEVAAIKLAAPRMLQEVVDAAIQLHGGAGLSRDDSPLPGFFAQARALRIADGPDEVHQGLIARAELARHGLAESSR